MAFTPCPAHLVNGGCLDLEGLGYSTVAGNQSFNPMPADADFDATLASRMGPVVNGGITTPGQNYNYGVNTGNTNNTSLGGAYLIIKDNSMHGLGGGSIRIYGGRNVLVTGNQVVAASDSNTTSDHNFFLPIVIGNLGAGPKQRAQGVTVTTNSIVYAGSSVIFAVVEDAQYGAFSSSDVNRVYDNDLHGNLLPFRQDSGSGSLSN